MTVSDNTEVKKTKAQKAAEAAAKIEEAAVSAGEASDAAPEKTNEERLAALIEKGKKVGKLTSKELMDVLENMNLEAEQIDKFYDQLENLGIETAGEDYLRPIDEEALPELEEL
ncbi:MAG: RNA polymerase sigma factor region1.1 domain-containing protein, partial [Oscillospiraceae bacterium]